jgi:mono/diheme cytochrome c family protein
MEGSTGWTLVAVEALHLLAAGAWLGGLIPLLLFLLSFPPQGAQDVVLRFSRLGLACVVTLALTIAVQSWILIGGLPGLVGTEYGLLALLKLALFLGLLGIAVLNRFRYTPALMGETGPAARQKLQWSVIFEAMVGLCAVLAAGVLLTQPPAIHEQPDWPFPYQFSLVTQSDPDLRNETLFGATLAIVAFACLCLAVAWRRGRVIALAAAIGFGWWSWPHLSLLLVPAYPTSFYHSPTGFTAASIARGSELFMQNCTTCHGNEGRGNGALAKNLPIPPADLTAQHLFEHSDGEMFWWLSHGIEGPDGNLAMPGFADALDEDARWNLIDYVRAHNAGLAVAEGGHSPKPIMARTSRSPWKSGQSRSAPSADGSLSSQLVATRRHRCSARSRPFH